MVMVPSLFQVQVNLQVLLAILVVARELLIEVLPAMVQIQDEKELVVLGVVVDKGEKLMPFERISTANSI
jgi:Na+-transporting NADH:ubiquinone oxidoreductase subunit NqrF